MQAGYASLPIDLPASRKQVNRPRPQYSYATDACTHIHVATESHRPEEMVAVIVKIHNTPDDPDDPQDDPWMCRLNLGSETPLCRLKPGFLHFNLQIAY